MEACARLFADVYSHPPWNEPWTEETARRRLEQLRDTPGPLCLIAVDNEPRGFLCGRLLWEVPGGEFEIDEMGVHPKHRRCGIGGALLEHLESHLADRGVEKILLLTRRGIPAVEFHESCGYHVNERTLVMSKAL